MDFIEGQTRGFLIDNMREMRVGPATTRRPQSHFRTDIPGGQPTSEELSFTKKIDYNNQSFIKNTL